MKTLYLLLLGCLLLTSCKKGKGGLFLSESDAKQTKTALVILDNHSKNAQNFKTAFVKGTLSYSDENQKQKANIDIMIEKDQQIFIHVRAYGISIAKALITPQQVNYYSKLNKSYFEGDYRFINQLLGTEVNFNRLQNILLGQLLDSHSEQPMTATLEDGMHKLTPTESNDIESAYFFEDKNSLLKKESITDYFSDRRLTISYPNYRKIHNFVIPTAINIEAEQEKVINLDISYDNVSFNEDLPINYKVPKDYQKIEL